MGAGQGAGEVVCDRCKRPGTPGDMLLSFHDDRTLCWRMVHRRCWIEMTEPITIAQADLIGE